MFEEAAPAVNRQKHCALDRGVTRCSQERWVGKQQYLQTRTKGYKLIKMHILEVYSSSFWSEAAEVCINLEVT
jgi:hypothetical protein